MTHLRTSTLRHWAVHLAVAALLLAQSFGMLHRVAHQPLRALADASSVVAGGDSASQAWSHERDSSDCRLFDQLSHADLAPLTSVVAACHFGSAPAGAPVHHGHTPAPLRHYGARAPPLAG